MWIWDESSSVKLAGLRDTEIITEKLIRIPGWLTHVQYLSDRTGGFLKLLSKSLLVKAVYENSV